MTQFIIVISPIIIVGLIEFAKYCVKKFAQYKTIKLLIESKIKHALVTEDQILF